MKRSALDEGDDYHSFDNHAPRDVIATDYDDLGVPMCEKSADGDSLFLKIKSRGDIPLTVRVNTEKGEVARQNITALPSTHNQSGIVKMAERARGFTEKQIVIESSEYSSPFSLCSMAVKFQPKEKLKKG